MVGAVPNVTVPGMGPKFVPVMVTPIAELVGPDEVTGTTPVATTVLTLTVP